MDDALFLLELFVRSIPLRAGYGAGSGASGSWGSMNRPKPKRFDFSCQSIDNDFVFVLEFFPKTERYNLFFIFILNNYRALR